MSYGTVQAEKMTTESGYSLGAGNASSFKNRIINGNMVIDQRNAGASVTPASFAYTLDRWQGVQTTASKFSVQQNAAAVTPPAGFTNYLGVTSLSAYSVAAGDTFNILQSVEGFNCSDFAWGTASAKTVTLSFWVRSSLTGTFGGAIKDGSSTNAYPFSYTISTANTWEQKSVTIVGPTAGQFSYTSTTNGIGLQVVFGLGAGATFSGTAGAWAAVNAYTATGATSVVGTNGATFYMTGVQLEVGTVATSFDFRSYGTELALCQRYYVDLANNGGATQNNFRAIGFGSTYNTTAGTYVVQVPVPMRTLPALSQAGTMYLQNLGSTSVSSFAGPYSIAGTIVEGDFTMVGAVAANAPGILRWNNSATQRFAYSAEL
jgi:hypothetical protein